jgi:Bacterial toxin 23
LCIGSLYSGQLNAQDLIIKQNKLGFNIGANLAFGSHVRRLGINLNFFYVEGDFQSNSEVRMYLNFRNLGPRGFHPEIVLAQGILYGYGAKTVFFNPFLNSVSNQTGHLNSFAYSYNAFFNTKKTKQQTGIFSIEVNRFSLITENDILARGYYDRFRTAAFLIQYQFEDKWQAAINCAMWTGQHSKKKANESLEFYNGCFMDTTGGRYTNYSHGLLSAQFKYNLGYSQNVQANLGVDAEQIRNVMQNKFIHDMRFIPKKWNKAKNCHIPMLDEKGNQYLYNTEQKIRATKLYWNVYSNANVFY